jgi:hypothetical protein
VAKTVNKLIRRISETRGSISILIVGLFSVLLFTSLILIDISSIYIAKRTLTLATEAAAQQGVKNLDQAAYYRGEFNVNRFDLSVWGFGEKDPGIPIDCEDGLRDAEKVLGGWEGRDENVSTSNLESVRLLGFSCDGFQMKIKAAARALLPIPLPFLDIHQVELTSQASAIAERAITNNYSGVDIG